MLTQAEADAPIAMEKSFLNPGAISLGPGDDVSYELIGQDRRERFWLDLWRGLIRLTKLKFQTRARNIVVLVRLDIDGAPHTNPDGGKIGSTHLYLYREGFEDRWAYPLDPHKFRDPTDIRQIFYDCRYSNILNIPRFSRR